MINFTCPFTAFCFPTPTPYCNANNVKPTFIRNSEIGHSGIKPYQSEPECPTCPHLPRLCSQGPFPCPTLSQHIAGHAIVSCSQPQWISVAQYKEQVNDLPTNGTAPSLHSDPWNTSHGHSIPAAHCPVAGPCTQLQWISTTEAQATPAWTDVSCSGAGHTSQE